ncbi:MAG: hypothetical protein ACI4WW_05240 [Candidatus Coprovivens sp.]
MNKRLVIILCCFFVISIVLLGASFSQESGQDKVLSTVQDVSDNMRVIYSSKTVNKDNKVIDLSIINKSSNIKDYVILVEGLEDYSNIRYVIDGEEKELSEVIYFGTLSSLGIDGDYKSHNIEFIFDTDIEFYIVVKEYNGELSYGSK